MILKGTPVSEGIKIGKVFLYKPFIPDISEETISEDKVLDNIAIYLNAQQKAKIELEEIQKPLLESGDDKAKIFNAHIDILFDETIVEEIEELIKYDLLNPAFAVSKVFKKYIKKLSKIKDELIRERIADMNDVSLRLIRNIFGVKECNLSTLDESCIVVANDLFPSDTASMDKEKVLAIVTQIGGPTSHTAIIAKSYEIPAILGVNDVTEILKDGEEVIVDAVNGEVFTQPTEQQKNDYNNKSIVFEKERATTKEYIDKKPITKDGIEIDLELNIGSANKQELAGEKYTNGVGLFRTEFLYMGKQQLPTEEEQFEIYKKVLLTYGERPVTLRTLDIGGDKKLDCMELPKEDNPFLGNRALRLCFTYKDIFKTQLRAALRASVYGNLWIMFPMVGSIDDINNAKAVVNEVKEDLKKENIPYKEDTKIGIMVEIPSIAVIADIASKESDFASIGTNDLCQYLTAVDRLNPAVKEYYQSYHPAMLRMLKRIVTEYNKNNKPICVCGELGGDPLTIPVLIGFGMRKLSMGLASVAKAKQIINSLTIEKAEEIANTALTMTNQKDIKEYLKEQVNDILK